jgi:hypothetical protein
MPDSTNYRTGLFAEFAPPLITRHEPLPFTPPPEAEPVSREVVIYREREPYEPVEREVTYQPVTLFFQPQPYEPPPPPEISRQVVTYNWLVRDLPEVGPHAPGDIMGRRWGDAVSWEATGGGGPGGGVPEAPIDGTVYGRQDGAWAAIPAGTLIEPVGAGTWARLATGAWQRSVALSGDTMTGGLTINPGVVPGGLVIEGDQNSGIEIFSNQGNIAAMSLSPAPAPGGLDEAIVTFGPMSVSGTTWGVAASILPLGRGSGFYIGKTTDIGSPSLAAFFISDVDGHMEVPIIRTTAGDPVGPNDLARKAYVDAMAFGDAPADGVIYGRTDNSWIDVRFAGNAVISDATLTGDGSAASPLGVVTATDTQRGGVVAPLGRTATQGLVNIGGSLSVPLATPALAGSMVDAPADGRVYTRVSGRWAPAALGAVFTFMGPITVIGDDQINAATPRYILTVPQASLPDVAIVWCCTGGGVGTMFMTNAGAGPIGAVPGSMGWGYFIEDGFNSGNWISLGSPGSLNNLNVADPVLVKGGTSPRLLSYDPATGNGIRIGFGMTGGTNAGFNSVTFFIGIEGQILFAA